ncbi:hypothetical protein CEXT_742841 [Caerostris extrusa]|uniref:Uncharacterized protein n=1 Tax=Caerostris extrusa TaxID=172846 RepID=A0AAV4WCH4_CAEEX|nr:hypothetical protein CEXT_742841 [Caerostris extrusa]
MRGISPRLPTKLLRVGRIDYLTQKDEVQDSLFSLSPSFPNGMDQERNKDLIVLSEEMSYNRTVFDNTV